MLLSKSANFLFFFPFFFLCIPQPFHVQPWPIKIFFLFSLFSVYLAFFPRTTGIPFKICYFLIFSIYLSFCSISQPFKNRYTFQILLFFQSFSILLSLYQFLNLSRSVIPLSKFTSSSISSLFSFIHS